MSPIAYHILTATGIEPPARTEEPPATRGDRWVGAGVAIIALALAGMIWAGWVKW